MLNEVGTPPIKASSEDNGIRAEALPPFPADKMAAYAPGGDPSDAAHGRAESPRGHLGAEQRVPAGRLERRRQQDPFRHQGEPFHPQGRLPEAGRRQQIQGDGYQGRARGGRPDGTVRRSADLHERCQGEARHGDQALAGQLRPHASPTGGPAGLPLGVRFDARPVEEAGAGLGARPERLEVGRAADAPGRQYGQEAGQGFAQTSRPDHQG